MTNGTASTPAMPPLPVLGDLAHNWGWLLAQGLLLVVLGTVGLGMTIVADPGLGLYFRGLSGHRRRSPDFSDL